MTMLVRKALWWSVLASSSRHIHGFSSGAGGCEGNGPAVQGFHLNTDNDRPVVPGDLEEGQIRVLIGTQTLDPSQTVEIPTGEDLLLQVIADDISFLGVLARLEFPDSFDTTGTLVPGANTQDASVCTDPNVEGITHGDNMGKTMATGTVRVDSEVDATLDVTVVFVNVAGGSAFVHDTINVQFRDATQSTVAPTASPVTAPVSAPAPSPIGTFPTLPPAPPTDSPSVAQPTNQPVFQPAPVNVGKGGQGRKRMGKGMKKKKGKGRRKMKSMKRKGKGKRKRNKHYYAYDDDLYNDIVDHDDDGNQYYHDNSSSNSSRGQHHSFFSHSAKTSTDSTGTMHLFNRQQARIYNRGWH